VDPKTNEKRDSIKKGKKRGQHEIKKGDRQLFKKKVACPLFFYPFF
jgi:hypothetical protein